MPDRAGLDAEGEMSTTGFAPPPYTRAAAIVVVDARCPTTATTLGSAYSLSAVRTAASSLPESSATRSSISRPRTPPLALTWFTANWAARSIEAPRGWEKGPARPIAIWWLGLEHAARQRAAPIRAELRSGPSKFRRVNGMPTPAGRRARLRGPAAKRNIASPQRISTRFSRPMWTIGAARPGGGGIPILHRRPERRAWSNIPRRARFFGVEALPSLCRFADALNRLLAAADAAAFDRTWEAAHVDRLAWEALALARRAATPSLEPALAQVDRGLLAVLER